MYRVNSTSKQIVRLNVVESGRLQLVELLPKNFVFTEKVTDQMRLLEREGVIRVRETKVKSVSKPVAKAPEQPVIAGKIDIVSETKVAKVQKKRK